jgi:hypothetical protein
MNIIQTDRTLTIKGTNNKKVHSRWKIYFERVMEVRDTPQQGKLLKIHLKY